MTNYYFELPTLSSHLKTSSKKYKLPSYRKEYKHHLSKTERRQLKQKGEYAK